MLQNKRKLMLSCVLMGVVGSSFAQESVENALIGVQQNYIELIAAPESVLYRSELYETVSLEPEKAVLEAQANTNEEASKVIEAPIVFEEAISSPIEVQLGLFEVAEIVDPVSSVKENQEVDLLAPKYDEEGFQEVIKGALESSNTEEKNEGMKKEVEVKAGEEVKKEVVDTAQDSQKNLKLEREINVNSVKGNAQSAQEEEKQFVMPEEGLLSAITQPKKARYALLIDAQTQCQYFLLPPGTMSLRYTKEGRPMCGEQDE